MPVPFQARTERDLKRPGYCAISHMHTLISLVGSGQLHKGEEITPRRLGVEFGFPKSEKYLVLAASRNLRFVDEHSRITDILEQLAHATGDEYKAKFKEVLEDSYADVFDYGLDLPHATHQEFKQAFQACNYEPFDMQMKMIALFKGLARMAGILQDESNGSPARNGQIASTPSSISSLNAVPLVLVEDTSMLKPSQSNGLHPSQSDFARVRKLVASIARLDQLSESANSSEANLALWMEYVKMSYDFLGDALTQIERDKR